MTQCHNKLNENGEASTAKATTLQESFESKPKKKLGKEKGCAAFDASI